jgi:uncharacterized hydantoinase/oxoprolinase family protein
MASAVPFQGRECPLAAELFATALDVYLLLRDIPESAADLNTADGRPATRAAARARLARMLCCDCREFPEEDACAVARSLHQSQLNRLAAAARRVVERFGSPCNAVLTCGEGEFMPRRLMAAIPGLSDAEVMSLDLCLGAPHSRAACGFALARLLRERLGPAPAADDLN